MQGRKTIPIAEKKAKGTYRKHREKEAPKHSEKKPCAPSNLSKRAKQIFWHMTNRLNEVGFASATYTETIALLAREMERVEILGKFIDENGYSYKVTGTNGEELWKPYSEVKAFESASRHVHSLLLEFGLTPASVQKVGVKKDKPKQNDFEDF